MPYRKIALVLFPLTALAFALFYPPSRPLSIPMLIGSIFGMVFRLVMPLKPEIPLKPIGRNWQIAWWVMVGLAAIGVFVPILRYFVPLLLIVIAWGYMMYRYRVKMGVQT